MGSLLLLVSLLAWASHDASLSLMVTPVTRWVRDTFKTAAPRATAPAAVPLHLEFVINTTSTSAEARRQWHRHRRDLGTASASACLGDLLRITRAPMTSSASRARHVDLGHSDAQARCYLQLNILRLSYILMPIISVSATFADLLYMPFLAPFPSPFDTLRGLA
jgi:hypothetical protein